MRTSTITVIVAIPLAVAGTVAVAPRPGTSARASVVTQEVPRDLPPGSARPASEEENQLQGKLAASPTDTRVMLDLARLQENRGAVAEAEATLMKMAQADPSSAAAWHPLAAFYNRSGRFNRAIEVLERAADKDPANPGAHHLVGTYYFEKANDSTLGGSDKSAYIERGLAAEDRALATDPEFMPALVYKNLLLRAQAATERDPGRRQVLIREADGLRTRAAQARQDASATHPVVSFANMPPPPPPPPVPGAGEIEWVYADTSYVATGNAKAPRKITDVRPVYPPMAISLGVQGTVVVEAAIDERGRVVSARIVESVRLLDQSAIDAVRQWQFEATTERGGTPTRITVEARFVQPR
jgi:TonB family protein